MHSDDFISIHPTPRIERKANGHPKVTVVQSVGCLCSQQRPSPFLIANRTKGHEPAPAVTAEYTGDSWRPAIELNDPQSDFSSRPATQFTAEHLGAAACCSGCSGAVVKGTYTTIILDSWNKVRAWVCSHGRLCIKREREKQSTHALSLLIRVSLSLIVRKPNTINSRIKTWMTAFVGFLGDYLINFQVVPLILRLSESNGIMRETHFLYRHNTKSLVTYLLVYKLDFSLPHIYLFCLFCFFSLDRMKQAGLLGRNGRKSERA